MSLIRLLAAGSSLSDVKDRLSPYRMTHNKLLPKFGGEKPFEAKTTTVAVRTISKLEQLQTAVEPVESRSRENAYENLDPNILVSLKTQQLTAQQDQNEGTQMIAAEVDIKKNVMPEVNAPRTKGLFRRWTLPKIPFRSKAQAKPAMPVQGELRLESVKVVRNELNDTDLDIVRMEKRQETTAPLSRSEATPGEATLQVNEKSGASTLRRSESQASKVVWQRVAARLFGATKS